MTDQNEANPLSERIADSVRAQLDNDSSRRRFLSRSAFAGGTLLALGGGTGLAIGQQEEDEGGNEASDGTTATFDDVDGTDVDVLNYALSLERLEDALYSEALDTFDQSDFTDAGELAGYDEEFLEGLYGYFESIAEHESAHVDVLTQAIELLGGEPAEEASYSFDFQNLGEFLSVAQELENTGVAAYAGVAPYIESPDLLAVALSIHSVEARHAALLNELNGGSPFPNAFDPASSQDEVLDAVSGFTDGEEEEEETEEADDEETDDEETDTPESDSETGTDGQEPGNETETPGLANETGTPDLDDETGTPGNGTDVFGNDTATPGNGTDVPGNGTNTPGNGS